MRDFPAKPNKYFYYSLSSFKMTQLKKADLSEKKYKTNEQNEYIPNTGEFQSQTDIQGKQAKLYWHNCPTGGHI